MSGLLNREISAKRGSSFSAISRALAAGAEIVRACRCTKPVYEANAVRWQRLNGRVRRLPERSVRGSIGRDAH